MHFKFRRYAPILLVFAGLFALSGCGDKEKAGDGVSAASFVEYPSGIEYVGPEVSKEDTKITVTLITDKASYEEGEDIHYALTVRNDRKGYTVSRVFATASNSDILAEEEIPSFSGAIPDGEYSIYEGTIKSAENVMRAAKPVKEQITGQVESVTLRPYVTVSYGGEEVTIRYIVEIIMFQQTQTINPEYKKVTRTVSSHDPAIVVGEDKEGKKCYYVFGSHRAWAKSYDLENWEYFTNNLSNDYRDILKEPAAWSAHGSKNYKVDGYMWAPDVIYNKAMKKWCMYLSVDGDNWYSSIVLLTADTIEGDWTYEGIVVYSGFRTDEFYDETDVASVTGESKRAERYNKNWGNNYPNNIDACVFYDDEGNLWMSYGSWSGGIFMLKLDESTGFRDLSVTYEENIHSDPYFGKKIAGGQYVSGEASYIQKIGDYYWLFISYGALEAKGGYNVRVFRSKTPDGDYVDELGNTPFFDSYVLNFNMPVGVRLFGGYKWLSFYQGQVAQGHNSAFVDDDGKAYIVFHTRTTDGSEGHYVKVHQLFLNEEGWLVAAPYQTMGESLNESGFDVSEVAGEYDVIIHKLNINYSELEVNKPVRVELNSDGSVTGGLVGTWSLKSGTPYMEITLDGKAYSGVTLKMAIENSTLETMTFTALGTEDQITVWGSRVVE